MWKEGIISAGGARLSAQMGVPRKGARDFQTPPTWRREAKRVHGIALPGWPVEAPGTRGLPPALL